MPLVFMARVIRCVGSLVFDSWRLKIAKPFLNTPNVFIYM